MDDDLGSARDLNRRDFLKASGAASAVVGGAGLGLFGYAAAKDPAAHLGWQNEEGAGMTFNRARYEVDEPTYEVVGPTTRADARVGNIFERRGRFMRQYREVQAGGEWDEPLKSFYEANPKILELDIQNVEEVMPALRADSEQYGDQYLLPVAWSQAMFAVTPSDGFDDPPEIADFPMDRAGKPVEPQRMKDPALTAALVKKVSMQFGSTLVGITELNPDWVYQHPIRGRGFESQDDPLEVPEHWKYAVVVGSPMSWDPLYANPTHGTSFDAYSRARIVAARLTAFIKSLGYAARMHIPGNSYDLMVPPIAIDAGLGEHGRLGVMITPELGPNFRPAVVTTNLPMATDKPIDFGVQDFCSHCKICAENCPSGAISMEGPEEVRGYRRWVLDAARCNNFWNSSLGSMGCRVCIAVCPYSRQANWLHKSALRITANDPTGLSERALTGLQKAFYEAPHAQDYYIPSLGGSNATYRDPPWWLRTEDFIDLG